LTALLHLLVLVPIAYVAALLAGAAILTIGLFGGAIDQGTAPIALGVMVGVTLYGGMASAFPALIAVAIAEAFSFRSIVYYLIAGATVGYVCHEIVAAYDGLSFSESLLELTIASGAVGGFVYWLIAGGNAGAWQVPLGPPTSTG
jgi:hypothetical protein